MADKLVIGVELLDYTASMVQAVGILEEAREKATKVEQDLSSEENYYGSASTELEIFSKQLVKHLDKLILLYGQGASYIYNTYESMYQSDEAMAVWMFTEIIKEGGIL